MHIAGKISLVLGALLFFIGGVGMVIGIGDAADGFGEIEESFASSQSSGSFSIPTNGTWIVDVYVIHPVDCDSLQLSITDSTGYEVVSDDDYCILMSGNEDSMESPAPGTEEFYSAFGGASDMEYSYASNVNLNIRATYCDAECEEARTDGALSLFGGFGGVCCGVLFIGLGVLLAVIIDDPKPSVIMPMGQMPQGQVLYQAPVPNQQPVQQIDQQPTSPVASITPPLTDQASSPASPITPPTSEEAPKSPWDF
ncbi:MAG: hypothetical protein CMA63_07330 [Euryarchaeota archaeon]|nr:hypothetical protein [Euryarchaeota archaeon]|tara:strand:+ start:3000 stop:3761 length:762 start_codon:yes stop_codon:yes gene_type:complete